MRAIYFESFFLKNQKFKYQFAHARDEFFYSNELLLRLYRFRRVGVENKIRTIYVVSTFRQSMLPSLEL